jgi:hypothetical protein
MKNAKGQAFLALVLLAVGSLFIPVGLHLLYVSQGVTEKPGGPICYPGGTPSKDDNCK